MSLSSSFGGDLEGIGEEVIDTDELESDVVPVVNKGKVRRQSSGLLKLRRSLHKIAQLYDPENDKTVVSTKQFLRNSFTMLNMYLSDFIYIIVQNFIYS